MTLSCRIVKVVTSGGGLRLVRTTVIPLPLLFICGVPYKMFKSLNQSMCVVLPGDFFIPSFQCPHRLERIGVLDDGGKWVCGLDRVAKQDKCVIYSFGLPPFLCCHLPFLMAHADRYQRRIVV
jgi:hypothetical protein